ncbi:phosphopantetheine-binding protein [Pendulispora albinea]|uniref:Phosphopantetheine-binding protein n=1 Tax=Pendulispora albinea TaxID=2741071 RepID=A0ABZ2M3N6_9BACT
MNKERILETLKRYIADEILEGDGADLEADTPLLELGVLNSLEVARMMSFVQRTMGFVVPAASIRVENLGTLSAITDMVFALQPK